MNLCDDCVSKKNLHSQHNLNFYDFVMFKNIQNIALFVNDKIYVKYFQEGKQKYDYSKAKQQNFLIILMAILICTDKYFCKNIQTTINSIKDFIDKKPENKPENDNAKSMEKSINIKNKNEFSSLKNSLIKINSIEIIKNNFYDISVLKNINFTYLITLSLSDNNIVDISPLKNMNAPNLKDLILSTNKITDEYINVIDDMNFPNLTFINLCRNYFHDYNLFKYFKKFKYLKALYTGYNKFEKNDNNNGNIKYEMQNLTKLGCNSGVFSNITIKLISNFNFINLKELYLSGNKLNSLDFVEDLKCEKLEKFWAFSNNFQDFWPLIKFTYLIEINLKRNFIRDIAKIEEFVDKLKQLKEFNLSLNKIKEKSGEIKIGNATIII